MIRTFFCVAALVAGFASGALPVLAQDVTLTSRDGSVEVSGMLHSYDGEFYRVETSYGVLTIDGQGVSCAGVGCPDLGRFVARFTIAGDAGMGEVLLPALIEGFAARHGHRLHRIELAPGRFRIDLHDGRDDSLLAEIGFRLGTAEQGFADLAAADADIVMSMREVTAPEIRTLRDAGLGDLGQPTRRHIIGLDALVPVVAPGNGRLDMPIGLLRSVFEGDDTLWPGTDAPLSLHLSTDEAALRRAVLPRLMLPEQPKARPERHPDAATLADYVATDSLALGLVRQSEPGNARALAIRGGCGMALPFDRQAIKAEDYPLTTPLFLYTPARRQPLLARRLMEYFTTPEAQVIVREAGFVSLIWEKIPLARQGARLAAAIAAAGDDTTLVDLQDMLGQLDRAVRLTTTFRFRDGSTELDAQSYGNIAPLARALERGDFDGRELIFAGFTDGAGPAKANRALSRQRAQAVRDAVRRAGYAADFSRITLHVSGFGEALPMACDDSAWGRGVNRRVEVWLR